jgi:hypothetical protein
MCKERFGQFATFDYKVLCRLYRLHVPVRVCEPKTRRSAVFVLELETGCTLRTFMRKLVEFGQVKEITRSVNSAETAVAKKRLCKHALF